MDRIGRKRRTTCWCKRKPGCCRLQGPKKRPLKQVYPSPILPPACMHTAACLLLCCVVRKVGRAAWLMYPFSTHWRNGCLIPCILPVMGVQHRLEPAHTTPRFLPTGRSPPMMDEPYSSDYKMNANGRLSVGMFCNMKTSSRTTGSGITVPVMHTSQSWKTSWPRY